MPKNARSATHGGRYYVWGRGGGTERYWSVTTILSALPKDALKFWAAKQVAEFAVDRSKTWFTMSREEAVDWLKREPLRFTGERADFGTAVHAAAEAYALRKPLRGDFSDEERAAAGQLLRYVHLLEPRFVATEASVYNRSQRYAGTLDSIQDISFDRLKSIWAENVLPWRPPENPTDGRRPGDVRLLIDYKTGGDIDEGKGVYPEVALQLAAYSRAEFMGAPNGAEVPLPAVDGAAVLHIQAGGWRLVPVNALDPAVFRSFLFVREVFRWIEETSKGVLGIALDPPADEVPAVVDDTVDAVAVPGR